MSVCVYLYIFVYHLYSWAAWVRLSLSVRTIMISPPFGPFIATNWLPVLDSAISDWLERFGPKIQPKRTRTRAQSRIGDNGERVSESVCEQRRSGERGIQGEWTAALGEKKRFGFNFFTFEIFIFLLLCFFFSGFLHCSFFLIIHLCLLSLCPQKEKILLLKTVDSYVLLLPLVCLTVFSLFIFSLLLFQMI